MPTCESIRESRSVSKSPLAPSFAASLAVVLAAIFSAEHFVERVKRQQVVGRGIHVVYEPGVVNYQIRQQSLNQLLITMVVNSEYETSSETRVQKMISRYMGADVAVSFDYVSDIPLTPSGKHRWIISEITSSADSSVGPMN